MFNTKKFLRKVSGLLNGYTLPSAFESSLHISQNSYHTNHITATIAASSVTTTTAAASIACGAPVTVRRYRKGETLQSAYGHQRRLFFTFTRLKGKNPAEESKKSKFFSSTSGSPLEKRKSDSDGESPISVESTKNSEEGKRTEKVAKLVFKDGKTTTEEDDDSAHVEGHIMTPSVDKVEIDETIQKGEEMLHKSAEEKKDQLPEKGTATAAASPQGTTSTIRKDGITISEKASDIPVKRVIAKVWAHLWPKGQTKMKVLVVSSVACVLLAKTLKVAVPFWFKTIVDLLAPATATTQAIATVGPFAVGTFGCVMAYGICRMTASVVEELKTVLFAPVGGAASTTLAMEMFNKLHQLDLKFHLNRETGVLSKDLDRGSRAFWQLAYALLFMVVPTTFEMGLVCAALNAQAGPQFISIALVAVFSYITWTFIITNWRAKFRARYNALDSRVGGLIIDSLLNYETVKYFGSEKYESARIGAETASMNKELVRLDQTVALLNFGQQMIFVVASVLSLYLSTSAVVAGVMTVGDLVLVDALLMQLYLPLSYLGMIYREIQTSIQNMQAMILLLDQQSNVINSENALEYKYVNGTIELKDVCFEYKKDEGRHVLRNLSLCIPGGSTVAFVGPSGSGKSTIFRLLFRFYDPTSGQILIDGQPLEKIKLESFRDCIGVIPQDTVLFNESVRYNIRYGKMDATDAEVEEAARRASLHDTVLKMSNGYDTSVGERGLKLSGGEKQRVAIARVLLEEAPILLADEATSALDSTTELNVMSTLRKATNDQSPRTIILIAHRLSTVREADIIFVLDGKGGLAEQGTHNELLSRDSLYAKLWRQQLRDQRRAENGEDAEVKTSSKN